MFCDVIPFEEFKCLRGHAWSKELAFDYEILSFVLLVGIFLRVAFHLLLTVSLRSEMQAENIFKEQKGKGRRREKVI